MSANSLQRFAWRARILPGTEMEYKQRHDERDKIIAQHDPQGQRQEQGQKERAVHDLLHGYVL